MTDHRENAPAEAATRENGDWVLVPRGYLSCVEGVLEESKKHICPTESNFDDDMDLCIAQTKAALSTHQQQGECDECGQSKPVSELKLLDCPAGDCSEHVCFKCLYVRAPQPDTVTADQVNLALDTYHGRKRQWNAEDHSDMRAALTAALAARGKV